MHTHFNFTYIGNILNIIYYNISEVELFPSIAMKYFQLLEQIFLLELPFHEHCHDFSPSFLFTTQAKLEI